MKIAVLMACYNRKEKTLKCLRALREQTYPNSKKISPEIQVFLLDDASMDGTSEAVKEFWPKINVIHGSGNHFWCGGMRRAWIEASKIDPDYYLWLNDDTLLFPDALSNMMDHAVDFSNKQHLRAIIGNCYDNISNLHSYGGYTRLGNHPLILKLLPVQPNLPLAADTFNGNLVLISRALFQTVGLIGPYSHGLGDIDYGYRVLKAGGQNIVAPGYLAHCTRETFATYWKRGPSRSARWKMLNDRKSGLPWRDWLTFASKHGGPFWPLIWVRPYLRVLLDK